MEIKEFKRQNSACYIDMRVAPKVAPIFTRKPYWSTSNGRLSDEVSVLRKSEDAGSNETKRGVQRDAKGKKVRKVRGEIRDE